MNPWTSERGSSTVRGLTMAENHTYVNTGASSTRTADIPDIGFLTDASVYYNLPPPLPSAQCRGASLPRGRHAAQYQLTRSSASCPASPKLPPSPCPAPSKLPPAVTPRVGKGGTSPPPRPPVTPRWCESNKKIDGVEATISPPVKARGIPKPRSKKLPHTRSFDLDHIYQNLVKVTSKPRSNSFCIDLPWRRKKKAVSDTTPDIKEDSGEDGTRGFTQNHTDPIKEKIVKAPSESQANQGRKARCSSGSSCSSSSNENTSENESVADDCSTEVRPAVTYLRKNEQKTQVDSNNSTREEAVNLLYHTTATLPLHASRVSCSADNSHSNVDQRPALDVNANLDEWLRKERWLEKKRSSRNFRSNESGDIDITILYASDGIKWKNYLYDLFTHLVPRDDKARSLRVEASNVEEIDDDIGRLQAVRLKRAKLQVVIMSPCFLDHIAGHGHSDLGQVFRPQKVLALLLGVDDCHLNMAHLSALYSYNDWHKLKVRNMDLTFVYEVLTEGISILNSSELYSRYQDESNVKFKITPRKVTGMQQQVYIMLNDPVKNKQDIEVFIEGPNGLKVMVERFRLRNPYTVDFRMPDEFMVGSSLLLVTVLVNNEVIGSRQLKCESTLDTLRALLDSVSNPTSFMCQALNIDPTSDELDQKLSEAVKNHVPLDRLEEKRTDKHTSEFPTWVHFSAFYGLERLTWALLEIPGGEAALNSCNCHGHTPSVLAYQKGFHQLAQTLEDAALVASLAAKICYEPVNYTMTQERNNTVEDNYISPPPPRPVVPNGYDHLPSPQVVSPEKMFPSPAEIPKNTETSSQPSAPTGSPVPSYTSGSEACLPSKLPPPPYADSTCHPQSSSTTQTTSDKADGGRQEGQYLNMIVSQDYRQIKCNEYSADVYTLVTAWMEKKTNIKTFVEEHQEKIVQVKSKLDSNSMKEEYNSAVPLAAENESLVSSVAAAETPDTREPPVPVPVPDVKRQENMVEQFLTLIRGRRKHPHHLDLEGARPGDLPNDYIEDPTQGSGREMTPEIEEPSTSRVAALRKSVDPALQVSSLVCSNEAQKSSSCVSPKTMPLEERLPEPPPRPESATYLQLEDIHTPKMYKMEMLRKEINSPVRTRSSSDAQRRVSPSKEMATEPHYAHPD